MLHVFLLYALVPFVVLVCLSLGIFVIAKVTVGIHITYQTEGRLEGKTALITGGNRGIGKAVAKDFASRGATVIIASRNCIVGEKAVEEIIEKTGNTQVFYMHLDLSDLDSVRTFAGQFLETESSLDILVNNAGVGSNSSDKKTTKQGFEIVFGTNYFGHFLLTYLLEDCLRHSAPSRIINVSSVLHMSAPKLDFHHLVAFKDGVRYPQLSGYVYSKMANVMHINILSEMLFSTGVTANAVHPGIVKSDIWFPVFNRLPKWLLNIVNSFIQMLGVDEHKAAESIVYLAVDDTLKNVSGKYFDRCVIMNSGSYRKASDSENCWILWNLSKLACGISDSSPESPGQSLFESKDGERT